MRRRQPAGQPKTICSKCSAPLEPTRVGKQRYCKKCHAENMRSNRPRHSDMEPEARKRANARAYLHVYVRLGKVKKMPCCKCGSIDAEAHHDDYDKPLEVRWFCRSHHMEVHNGTTKMSTLVEN